LHGICHSCGPARNDLGVRRNDRKLLERIAAGDDKAFSSFYRAHLNPVVAFFRRRVPDAELAFDLAAETFAVVAARADSYDGSGEATAWLYGIARNKLRESLRRGRVEDEARRAIGLAPIALEDADLERVEERAAAGGPQLERALASLPEPIRTALLARVVDERDYDEIAAELQCSEQLVRQRVHRGLARLRAGLEEGR
jgi:RNA polymerase sigma-70 factor (ECF subfamily)